MKEKQKIVVILGPTASGKSDLAVELAKNFNGEVISADSRQVYRGLDIGSGKITKREMKGVPHHLLDVAAPAARFSVDEFKQKAERAIEEIAARGKLPIICGGTGFYIQALVDNMILPEVKPNLALRKKLAKMPTEELFKMFKALDRRRAALIDRNNPHRLIRAIEIATVIGKVPKLKSKPKYDALQIGIKTDEKILKQKIHKRLLSRMRGGMVAEVKRLHRRGLSWRRLEELGLEYRYLAYLLQGKMDRKEMLEKLYMETCHYAKRQVTWWKRDPRINWFSPNQKSRITKSIKDFTH